MKDESMKKIVFLAVPLVLVATVLALVKVLGVRESIAKGITLGLIIAVVETFFSVGLMKWALAKKVFYWVWGGGVLARFFVFFLTAFVVYRFTNLNVAATLVALVSATTLLLTLESAFFLKPK